MAYIPKINVDLGLSVLCVTAEQGQTLTFKDIADVCECNKTLIQAIQKSALDKLKAQPILQDHFYQLN